MAVVRRFEYRLAHQFDRFAVQELEAKPSPAYRAAGAAAAAAAAGAAGSAKVGVD